MCLLFFKSKENPSPSEYKLVLVNVRDEFYTRPSRPAEFWPENPDIIGGQDVLKGTWLAMNKRNGRIAILLNILQPNSELVSNKRSRGFIVNDFLTGADDHEAFLQELRDQESNYNGFQTIALQVKDGVSGSYYSNFVSINSRKPDSTSHNNKTSPPIQLPEGIHSFGNSLNPLDPWPKVTYGRKRFEAVMNKHRTTTTKEQLITDLLDMMCDKTLLPVDENMMTQGRGREMDNLRRLSSLCVEMPESMYGSR
jgi:uncharacterized protein with NRDE domain